MSSLKVHTGSGKSNVGAGHRCRVEPVAKRSVQTNGKGEVASSP
jgi:hypothetical protein